MDGDRTSGASWCVCDASDLLRRFVVAVIELREGRAGCLDAELGNQPLAGLVVRDAAAAFATRRQPGHKALLLMQR